MVIGPILPRDSFLHSCCAVAAGFRSPATIDSYLPEVTDVLENNIRKWAATSPGTKIRMVREAHLACAEIAARIFLGFDHTEAAKAAEKLAKWSSKTLNGAQSLPLPIPGATFWRAERAGDAAHAFILDRLEAHMNHSLPWNRPYLHALGVLAKRLEPGVFRPGLKYDTKEGVTTEVRRRHGPTLASYCFPPCSLV